MPAAARSDLAAARGRVAARSERSGSGPAAVPGPARLSRPREVEPARTPEVVAGTAPEELEAAERDTEDPMLTVLRAHDVRGVPTRAGRLSGAGLREPERAVRGRGPSAEGGAR